MGKVYLSLALKTSTTYQVKCELELFTFSFAKQEKKEGGLLG